MAALGKAIRLHVFRCCARHEWTHGETRWTARMRLPFAASRPLRSFLGLLSSREPAAAPYQPEEEEAGREEACETKNELYLTSKKRAEKRKRKKKPGRDLTSIAETGVDLGCRQSRLRLPFFESPIGTLSGFLFSRAVLPHTATDRKRQAFPTPCAPFPAIGAVPLTARHVLTLGGSTDRPAKWARELNTRTNDRR